MSFDLRAARTAAAALDDVLRPIAKRPIVNLDLDSLHRLMQGPRPLDEAGVRPEAEALMDSIIRAYGDGNSSLRASIRALLADAPSFAWATGVSFSAATVDGFRQNLL